MSKNLPSLQRIIFWVVIFFIAWPVFLYFLMEGFGFSLEFDEGTVNYFLIILACLTLCFVTVKRTRNIIKYRRLNPLDVKCIEFHIGGMVKGAEKGVDHLYLVTDWASRNLTLKDLIQRSGDQELEVDINGLHYSLLIPSLEFFNMGGSSLAITAYSKDPQLLELLNQLKGVDLKWHCTHINQA